jgi:hypothetical protein
MDASAENEELKRNDERKRVRMTYSNRRYFCYFLTTTLLFLAVSWVATTGIVRDDTRDSQPVQRRIAEAPAKQKILYIVTTLAEYTSRVQFTLGVEFALPSYTWKRQLRGFWHLSFLACFQLQFAFRPKCTRKSTTVLVDGFRSLLRQSHRDLYQ